MAAFQQVLNPITGRSGWNLKPDDYDYHQEVANTGFADMLHDSERNQKYFKALRKQIAEMRAAGREVHVLDIGTGTGLLSMMAVAAGADTVTACEAFIPMANCAERILAANGMSEKIKLIKKRSTELKIGADMQKKANLLVTEVLDTELIGEGAIDIYNHAHAELLTDDAICIPSKARCYAQVVQSPLAAQWNTMKAIPDLDGDILLKPLPNVLSCSGSAGLHDIQMSQLPLDLFRPITEPIEIFEFDFNRKELRETAREMNIKIKSQSAGSTDLVLYWWDIKMDLVGDIVLSCAPFWAHPDFNELALANEKADLPLPNMIPWRDHWVQALYYISKPLQLISPNTEFILSCNHDDYSLWFNIYPLENVPHEKVLAPACNCRFHLIYSRNRIGQMNQSQRNKRYLMYLVENITKNSNVLVLGNGCLLGLTAAKIGAATVTCHDANFMSKGLMEDVVQYNELKNVDLIDDLDKLDDNILKSLTHIFAEPYFIYSILPWDNFYFGTLISSIIDKINPNVQIAPYSARILAVPVEFLDLHKICTPVGQCEGFDLTLFDEMVKISASITQAKVEAQPLWEYPGRALAEPQEVLCVNFKQFDKDEEYKGIIDIKDAGSLNGIALWVDWHLDDSKNPKSTITTGPIEPIKVGQFIKWDMFVRQGVHLMSTARKVQANASTVNWSVNFKPKDGTVQFRFEVVEKT